MNNKKGNSKDGYIVMAIIIVFVILGMLFGWFIAIGIAIALLIIVGVIGNIFFKKSVKKYVKKMEEEKEQEQLDNLRYKIYKKCQEKGITSFKTKEAEEALLFIASNYGVNDLETAKDMYCKAEEKLKKDTIDKIKKAEQEKINNIKEQDLKVYNNATEDAKTLKGKEKYTYSLKVDLDYARKAYELSKDAEKIGKNNMNYTAHKSDPYIWAGLANGAGGLGAAMLTANDIEKQNLQEEKNAEIIREDGIKLYEEARNYQRFLPKVIEREESMIQVFEDKLFDDKKQDDKFDLLKIDDISYDINIAGNFEVKFEYEIDKKIEIINSPAILDGSLQIDIYDDDDIVATGIYNAPGKDYFDLKKVQKLGEDVCFKLSNSGFRKGVVKVTCVSKSKNIDKDKKYRVEIKPYYLWIIEL